ncbi:MAG TPA: tetraacyldisaccharide 4'-kinase [Bacteroidota bacterium]|nr:tetraacyldisaccharide 4'-kinase [Bacteroidota bacterium]
MKPVPALAPISWLYGAGIAFRNLFFDVKIFQTEHLDIPVISVGNITAGGTGKTPLVELIAKHLMRKHVRPAVVSRGYKRTSSGLLEVADGTRLKASAQEAGDEAYQLALRLPNVPIVVDEERVRGAMHAAQKLRAEVIILDDGFQHRSLHRDLDIVLIDASRPPFGMRMIPAGLRREPLSSLARAGAVVITRTSVGANSGHLREHISSFTKAPVFTSSYRIVAFRRAKTRFSVDLNTVKGKHAVAFCGIGNPDNFRTTLDELGVRIDAMIAFDDHRSYSPADARRIVAEQQKHNAEFVITTEKDVVRCATLSEFENLPLFYVEIETVIHELNEWEKLIDSIVEKKIIG